MAYKENVLKCLENSTLSKVGSTSRRENLIKKINESIKIYQGDEKYANSVKLASLVKERLDENNSDFAWSLKQFSDFKRYLAVIDEKNLKIGLEAIMMGLSLDDNIILEDLRVIAEKFSHYPDRVKEFDEDSGTYICVLKEIEAFDCFGLVKNIYSLMRRQIRDDLSLLQDGEPDFEILDGFLHDINNSKDENEVNMFLKNFDEKFMFLRDTNLYANLYKNFRECYITEMISDLRKINEENHIAELRSLPKGKNALARKTSRYEKLTPNERYRRSRLKGY